MRRLNLAVVALTLFTLASAGFAQQAATFTVPNLIRYGGTLENAEGAPLASSTVGVTSPSTVSKKAERPSGWKRRTSPRTPGATTASCSV